MNSNFENSSIVNKELQESQKDSLHVNYHNNYCSVLWKVYGKDANLNINLSCGTESVQKYVAIILILIQKLHEMKESYGYDFCGLLTHVVPELNKFKNKQDKKLFIDVSSDRAKNIDSEALEGLDQKSNVVDNNKLVIQTNQTKEKNSIEEDLGNLLNISQEDLEKLSKQLLQ